jgi:hypothetical protein
MTINEMKSLKIGDIVIDYEMSKSMGKEVICKVLEVDETGILITSINSEFKGGYPHRFQYEIESSSLDKK